MWIQFNNAFLSIVENRDNKLELLVRARVKGDIEKIFPEADVFEDDSADYKYRAFISKAKVAARMMLKMTEINYDNFLMMGFPDHSLLKFRNILIKTIQNGNDGLRMQLHQG